MIIKLILAQNYLKIALIGFVTRVTWWVPLVEQELFTLPEHMNLHPVFSEVCITRSLVFSVVFCRLLFILLSFSFWPYCLSFFDLRILITPVVSSNFSWKICFHTLYYRMHNCIYLFLIGGWQFRETWKGRESKDIFIFEQGIQRRRQSS